LILLCRIQFGISKRFPDKEKPAEVGSEFSATANDSFNNAPASLFVSNGAIPALIAPVWPTRKYQIRTGALLKRAFAVAESAGVES
jgi:hypothetical protein